MSEFEVGDKIKVVTGETEKYNGREGDLVRIKDSDPYEYIYRLKFDNQYGTVGFKANEIKKVDNMSDFKPFYVNVDGPNHSRILQEIAFEEGYEWSTKRQEVRHTTDSFLFFTPEGNGVFQDKEITYSNGLNHVQEEDQELEDPTLEEFRQALRGEYDWEDPIVVQGYEVDFYPEHIKVGCEEYSNADIKGIYNTMKKHFTISGNLHYGLIHDDVGEVPFEVVEAIYNRITE